MLVKEGTGRLARVRAPWDISGWQGWGEQGDRWERTRTADSISGGCHNEIMGLDGSLELSQNQLNIVLRTPVPQEKTNSLSLWQNISPLITRSS